MLTAVFALAVWGLAAWLVYRFWRWSLGMDDRR